MLWREQSIDALEGFTDYLYDDEEEEEIDVDNIFDYSCLIKEEDLQGERQNEDIVNRLQAGFTNSAKKLDMLKQGGKHS